tara:strand:- start:438 stop:659 length:222 start_codon:yes stop_codon:yes gene_type:complete
MDIFQFIIRNEDKRFVSIIKMNEDETIYTGVNLDIYSVITTDEQTAREHFLLAQCLPNDSFEDLLNEAKNNDN